MHQPVAEDRDSEYALGAGGAVEDIADRRHRGLYIVALDSVDKEHEVVVTSSGDLRPTPRSHQYDRGILAVRKALQPIRPIRKPCGGPFARLKEIGEIATCLLGKGFERTYATGFQSFRSGRAGWSLKDPGNVQAALQDRAKQALVLNGQGNVVEILRERAEMDMAQAIAKTVEKLARN